MATLGCRWGAVARAAAALGLIVGASLARAGEPKESAEVTGARTAANQSVWIEELPPPPVADAAATVAEVKPEGAMTVAPTADKGLLLPPRGEKRLRTAERNQPPVATRTNPSALTGLWPLFAVTALIGAVYVVMRRWRGGALVGSTGTMRVLGRLNLSPRHQLALVQVGQRVLVVGVSAGDMRTLHVVDDAGEAAMLAARAGVVSADGVFAEWLDKEGERFNGPEEETGVLPQRGPQGVSELLKKVRTMQTQ